MMISRVKVEAFDVDIIGTINTEKSAHRFLPANTEVSFVPMKLVSIATTSHAATNGAQFLHTLAHLVEISSFYSKKLKAKKIKMAKAYRVIAYRLSSILGENRCLIENA